MPLYRRNEQGAFVPFEKTPFADVERVLEDWIEANPHLLLGNEPLAILGRQVRTGENKILDLLALDRTGATVVIELKRGETPREVVAQAVEYAAWVDTLSREQLDEVVEAYGTRSGRGYVDVADLYYQSFVQDINGKDDEDSSELSVPAVVNDRQRIVIVAEAFSPEVERALRYLRTKHGMNITGVQFGIHTAGHETIVETEVVVGRERQVVAAQKATNATTRTPIEPAELTEQRVRTDFARGAVRGIPDWVQSLGIPGLEVRQSTGSDYDVKLGRTRLLHYYFAQQWVLGRLGTASAEEEAELKLALSDPEAVKRDGQGALRFHISTDSDLAVVQRLLLDQLSKLLGYEPSSRPTRS